VVNRPRPAQQRGYTMRARQENVDQTRLRITEATVRLHEEVGPAATTVSAVADRAGVTRLTVYRHFPDDEALRRQEQDRVTVLAQGFPAAGRKSHRLRTTLTHAIAFRTWQSLCMVGQLHDDEAVELMAAAVLAAVQTPVRRPKRPPRPRGTRQPG